MPALTPDRLVEASSPARELVYVLDGEITLIEGDAQTLQPPDRSLPDDIWTNVGGEPAQSPNGQ